MDHATLETISSHALQDIYRNLNVLHHVTLDIIFLETPVNSVIIRAQHAKALALMNALLAQE